MAVITLFGLFIAVMGVGIMSAWVTRVNTGRDGGHGAWFQTDNMRSATASFIEIHPPSGTCSQFVEVEKMTAECRLASAAAMTRYERDRADGLAARAR
jgi:hypothetical protein